MKRHLFGLSLVLATIALLGLAASAPAQDGDPFRLTGTTTDVELLGFTEDTFTLQITLSGEGTIGRYQEIAIVTFTHVGGTTWKFDGVTTISVLNDQGEPTGDEIYTTDSGTFSNLRNEGSFRIVGGTGLFDGATGSGAFHYLAPTGTYTGVIR
jgi:hypothetical protein